MRQRHPHGGRIQEVDGILPAARNLRNGMAQLREMLDEIRTDETQRAGDQRDHYFPPGEDTFTIRPLFSASYAASATRIASNPSRALPIGSRPS